MSVHDPAAEHESRDRRPRLPGPVYPIVALAFIGALVWAFSRVLLASDKTVAAVIALGVALNILFWSAAVAYGPRVRGRTVLFPFWVVAAVVVVAAGSVAAFAYGDRGPGEKEEAGATQVLALSAKNIAFSPTELHADVGGTVTIRFNNQDAGTPHNVVVFNGADESGPQLFRGEVVTGPTTASYSFPTPPAGQYAFHCEVHPNMKGTLTVGGAPPSEGPSAPTPSASASATPSASMSGPATGTSEASLTAQGIAFNPTELTLKSGTQATIHFNNQDAGTPHNVAIFQGSDATGQVVFRGDIVTGPAGADYTFTAPAPGTYFFHCDVHPQMTGTITFT